MVFSCWRMVARWYFRHSDFRYRLYLRPTLRINAMFLRLRYAMMSALFLTFHWATMMSADSLSLALAATSLLSEIFLTPEAVQ